MLLQEVGFSDLFYCLPLERLDSIAFPLFAKSSSGCRVVCPVYLMFLQESMLVCELKLQPGCCVFKTPPTLFEEAATSTLSHFGVGGEGRH